jgi:CubicO group peptidase (beta-lactamase class C family)
MPTFDDLLATIDERFECHRAEKGIPGVAWGVIRDGELVRSGGAGTMRAAADLRPDAGSVFRIASMTKSFTAATLLLLRDEGRLHLDDPVALHVPELEWWQPATADSGPVTVRQLLTMSAGLATDDPWGDRQQSLPLEDFSRLLAAGPTFAWAPGTMFDYSNLGYGILGRVITSVAGAEYRDVVRDRILRPLGMATTAYDADDVPGDRLAHGYVRQGDTLVREGTDGYGALASMGGIHSTVEDLARWVAGFLDAFPARSDAAGSHPLRRSSRREMQQAHRFFGLEVPAVAPDAEPEPWAGAYGFGLFIRSEPTLGTIVSHSGGYPGFGSNMAWHPASGIGVIGLGNLRYAPMSGIAGDVLRSLVQADGVRARRATPTPVVERYREVAEGLLASWDDAAADAAFAMNMDLDEPRERRRAAVERIAADLGPFRPDPARPVGCTSPAHAGWWLRGARGWARLDLLVSPEPTPRIQSLQVTAIADPSETLVATAEALLHAAASPEHGWPVALAVGDALDTAVVLRQLHAGSARCGSMTLALPTAGDGAATATWELATDRGRATLRVSLDAVSGAVAAAELRVPSRSMPVEAW